MIRPVYRRILLYLGLVVLSGLLFAFVLFNLLFQHYTVSGPSMEPGLHSNQTILVNRFSYLLQEPARGDIMVFHSPQPGQPDYIKRVIGLPGDTIDVEASSIHVNGVILYEPYIRHPINAHLERIEVKMHQYFVVGDNRANSDDSRNWGPIEKSLLVGKASFIYESLGSWQPLNTYHEVFDQLPHHI